VLVSAIVPAAEFRFNPPNLDSNAIPPLEPVALSCTAVAELWLDVVIAFPPTTVVVTFPALASRAIPPLDPVAAILIASAEDEAASNDILAVAPKRTSVPALISIPPVASISMALAAVPAELILIVEFEPPEAFKLTACATLLVPVTITLAPSIATSPAASISTPPAELISTAETPVPAELISKVVVASTVEACNLTAEAPDFLPVIVTTSLFDVILTALAAPEDAISTVPSELTSRPAEPASITTPAPVESASIVTTPVPVVTNLTPPFVPVATSFPPSASSVIWILPVSKPFLAHTRPVPSATLNTSVKVAGEPSLTAIIRSPEL